MMTERPSGESSSGQRPEEVYVEKLQRDEGDTGDVAVILREYPKPKAKKESTVWEDDYVEVMAALTAAKPVVTPEMCAKVADLLAHMLEASDNEIPECLNCKDSRSLPTEAGSYVHCPECL